MHKNLTESKNTDIQINFIQIFHNPKTIVSTLIILILLTCSAFTDESQQLINLLDPGLPAAREAGFVNELNLTAEPVIREEDLSDPLADLPPEQVVTKLGMNQTLSDVTVTLDWIYKEIGAVALMISFTDLPDGTRLEMPEFTYNRVYEYPDITFPDNEILRISENRMVAVSYGVANPNNPERTLDMTIDLPLIKEDDPDADPLAVFHFKLDNFFVPEGQGLFLQQTGSFVFNGYEVQLRSTRVTSETTEVESCYNNPENISGPWMIRDAALQIGGGEEIAYQSIRISEDDAGLMDYCAQLLFPIGSTEGDEPMIFHVRLFDAGEASAASLKGEWDFYSDIPSEKVLRSQKLAEELAESASLPTVEPGTVHMTLDWLYADVNRLDFGYHIYGLPYTPQAEYLKGSIAITNANDELIQTWGTSENEWVEGDSGTISGVWSAMLNGTLGEPPFRISLTLDGRPLLEDYQFLGQFSASIPDVKRTEDNALLKQVPGNLIGTFEFTADVPVYPLEMSNLKQSVEINGIGIRLEKVETTPAYSVFTLCYSKPSAEDWMIGGGNRQVLLKSGEFTASNRGYQLIYDPDFGGSTGKKTPPADFTVTGQEGMRCAELSFNLGKTTSPQKLVLTIPALQQSQPEVIPQDDIRAVREKLSGKGILFDYVTGSDSRGGGGGLQITGKPEGMSDSEAYDQIQKALGYIFEGPWVFEFELP
ncbi:MAG: hypothetical protein AB9907_16370 [Flexilinea sp.]